MTATKNSANALEILCRSAIEQNLGDLSKLPEELLTCIFRVYREFMTGYLNVLRQKEDRSADWIPAMVRIDTELADQMRHFFSDYQHITRKFYKLNRDINRLKAMDKDRHIELYQFTIDDILQQCEPLNTSGGRDEQTV
ncbi:MAG: hypothetical protein PVI13_10465 [Desulfobacterales bacterium]|jgi:hypothetical protein